LSVVAQDRATRVRTWHLGRALLPSGWASEVRITVAGRRIVGIEVGQTRQPEDISIPVGLPGMANLHSHSFQRAMSGLTEMRGGSDDSFWTWRTLMYRFVERLSPEAVEAITAFAYLEMLESGFTRVGEFHYLHRDIEGSWYDDPAEMSGRIVSAAASVGIGLTLLPVFYAHAGFGDQPAGRSQQRFLSDPESYALLVDGCRRHVRAHEGSIVGIAPHSLRAATPREIVAITPLAGDGPVHIHIAEQRAEVDACLAWSGARPVEWLLDNAAVDARWCLVHATHVTDAEVLSLARSGAVAGLCPITEANLGDGLFPAKAFVAAGGRYGVGSDSNVRIDLTEELRLLEYGQRLITGSRNVMTLGSGRSSGRALYEDAAMGGAAALGATGGLSIGASADLVALDAQHTLLAGRSEDSVVDTLVFGGARDAITGVWSGGDLQVEAGRHRHREAIERRYRDTVCALLDL